MYHITVISSGRDKGRDDAADTCFLWKITTYLLRFRNTKLHLSTRQRCIKYLPDYQMPHWLKSTFAGNSIALQIQLSCIPTLLHHIQPLSGCHLPFTYSASAESPSGKGKKNWSLWTCKIFCPNSFVSCWMKKILMWKCCDFPWGAVFPLRSCGSSHREGSNCQKSP